MAGSADVAPLVYAASFLHYPLYVSAYCYGRPTFGTFVRAALLLKLLALAAFGAAMASVSWSWPPLAVMAAGFALNARAASTLGVARTYYGWELGEVTFARTTAFPYSVCPHPMLLGNIAGFGGALLNPPFALSWWPLAATHVLCNVGLLWMETCLRAHRTPAATVRTSPDTHEPVSLPARSRR